MKYLTIILLVVPYFSYAYCKIEYAIAKEASEILKQNKADWNTIKNESNVLFKDVERKLKMINIAAKVIKDAPRSHKLYVYALMTKEENLGKKIIAALTRANGIYEASRKSFHEKYEKYKRCKIIHGLE